MPQPILSICIPTHNRVAMLSRCLEQLSTVLLALPFKTEIVVFNNASTDGTSAFLESVGRDYPMPPVRAIHQGFKLDVVESHFAALRHAGGRYAHYLADDDALVEPELIAAVVERLEREPEMVAMFCPQIEVRGPDDEIAQIVNDVVAQPLTLPRCGYLAAIEIISGQMFHPEVPMVRADAFRRHVAAPRKTFFGFWLLASLLKVGAVGIGTEAYYKHRLRDPNLPGAERQVQWEFAIDRMDQNRLGMELLFLRHMQSVGQLEMTEEQRRGLAEWFAVRMAKYAQVGARIANQQGDHQGAMELAARCGLWLGLAIDDADGQFLAQRVEQEIQRRTLSTHAPTGLIVVDTAEQRTQKISDGARREAVVARADIAASLRVCHG